MENLLNLLKSFEKVSENKDKITYKSFVLEEVLDLYKKLKNLDFKEIYAFSNGHRKVFVNKYLNSVFTYCEGDLIFEVFKTKEDYKNNYKKMEIFYSEY